MKTHADNRESTVHCLNHLQKVVDRYDGFLIACYADHLLTPALQSRVGRKPVVGIFDASIAHARRLTPSGSRFGILTTGEGYEVLLSEGVRRLLGAEDLRAFGGVVASGVGVDDLVEGSTAALRQKVLKATRRLVDNLDVDVVCMGGVILAGVEGLVREACVEALGAERGGAVVIVDQMRGGVMTLEDLAWKRAWTYVP